MESIRQMLRVMKNDIDRALMVTYYDDAEELYRELNHIAGSFSQYLDDGAFFNKTLEECF